MFPFTLTFTFIHSHSYAGEIVKQKQKNKNRFQWLNQLEHIPIEGKKKTKTIEKNYDVHGNIFYFSFKNGFGQPLFLKSIKIFHFKKSRISENIFVKTRK